MPHEFSFSLQWKGDTLTSAFNRNAHAEAPQKAPLALSSAPQYQGDPACWNPEELLAVALANCHMLTFLSLVAKNSIAILEYADAPVAILDTVEKVTFVTEIRLSPTILVGKGTDISTTRALFEKAHKYCFVANSIRSRVVMEPRIVET